MTDWATHLGQGPATLACRSALGEFTAGVDWVRAGRDGALPTERAFFLEGVGAGCVLVGEEPPALQGVLHHLLQLGVGMGLALQGGGPPDNTLQADGFGFASALIRPHQALTRCAPEPFGQAHRHGLGRALWFLEGGHPGRLPRLVRDRDVWYGLGMASVFTGGLDHQGLARLVRHGGEAFLAGQEVARAARHAVPMASGVHHP